MSKNEKQPEQHKEEVKPQPQVSDNRALIREIVEEVLPASVLASSQAVVQGLRPAPTAQQTLMADPTRCSTCLQQLRACKGKHVNLVVYPRNHRRGESFPGIQVNGVTYRSPRPGVTVPCPEQNDILHMVQLWEDSEDGMMTPRSAVHDSGSIGRSGTGFNPAMPTALG